MASATGMGTNNISPSRNHRTCVLRYIFKAKRVKIKPGKFGAQTNCGIFKNDLEFVSNFSLKENLSPEHRFHQVEENLKSGLQRCLPLYPCSLAITSTSLSPTLTSDTIPHNYLTELTFSTKESLASHSLWIVFGVFL